MCRLIESLKILDGQPYLVDYHQERLSRSQKDLFGSITINLKEVIEIPKEYLKGLVKCRVIYSHKLHAVEFQPYRKRLVNSLKIVRDDNIDYSHKYEDRSGLDALFRLRGDCDDILIIKKGWVTDAFSSNLVFLKNDQWYAPVHYLLKGTKREFLLNSGLLREKDISEKDIMKYDKVGLINAMVNLGDMEVEIDKIDF